MEKPARYPGGRRSRESRRTRAVGADIAPARYESYRKLRDEIEVAERTY